MNRYFSYLNTPIGPMKLISSKDAILEIIFCPKFCYDERSCSLVVDAMEQVKAYFNGKIKKFDIPLSLDEFTPFQKKVYNRLSLVKYGSVITYGKIAEDIGNPKAYRAVATAVGKNPFIVAMPCHRVIRCDNKIGKYRYGTWRKRWFLDFEHKK